MFQIQKSRLYLSIFAIFCISLVLPIFSYATLVNYENDPDLALALQYDSEYNGGNRSIASQSQAEIYYLKYLEKCEESFQRAKVYSQLGVLFATNFHSEYDEKPDFEKSLYYMKKALEEEPKRIGYETIRAHMFLDDRSKSRKERLESRLDSYEWILEAKSIAYANESESDIWLPMIPGQPLSENEIRSNRTLLDDIEESLGGGIVTLARNVQDPLNKAANLRLIIERFPDTQIAEKATRELAKVNETIQKELKKEIAPEDSNKASTDSNTQAESGTSEALLK